MPLIAALWASAAAQEPWRVHTTRSPDVFFQARSTGLAAKGIWIFSGGLQCFFLGAAVCRGHCCLLEDVSSPADTLDPRLLSLGTSTLCSGSAGGEFLLCWRSLFKNAGYLRELEMNFLWLLLSMVWSSFQDFKGSPHLHVLYPDGKYWPT